MVTQASKRKQDVALSSTAKKKPRTITRNTTLQGHPDLQVTVSIKQQHIPQDIQVSMQQASTATMQLSSLQPDGAVQGTMAWSLTRGPATTYSASWHPMLPQHHLGWQQPLNLIPPWPATWNLISGTYQHPLGPIHQPVPWMMTGMSQSSWNSSPPYHDQRMPVPHASIQQCMPTSTTTPMATSLNSQQPLTIQQQKFQMQQHAQATPTVLLQQSVATGTTGNQADLAGNQQNIPPVMPGILPQLTSTNMPGKTLNIISAHVPLSVKNKVWSYAYIDLATLLESTCNPDKEEQLDFFPDRATNKISFHPTTKHQSINTFNAWNKAFRVLTKLLAIKWPQLCLPLLQYTHLINEQAGKFPFAQVYAYAKRFHRQLATHLSIPWNQIDNQLWSRELHGQHPQRDKVSPSFTNNF